MKSVIIDGVEYIPKTKAPIEEDKKEWEIVAYRRKDKLSCITTKRENEMFLNEECEGNGGWVEPINNDKWEIFRVIRKSDGEVFTVGDECKWVHHEPFKITSFKIGLRNEMFAVDETDEGFSYDILRLEKPHLCKHCGATTFQPDDQCYKKSPTKQETPKEEFKWTDELVQECIRYAMQVSPTIEDVSKWIHVQDFKKSKTATSTKGYETGKERVEVGGFDRFIPHDPKRGRYSYRFYTLSPLEPKEFSMIEKSIERILNDDDNKFWETIQHHTDKAIDEVTKRKFTQEQMDKAIDTTWYAARKKNGLSYEYKYPTINEYLDYLKTLKTKE